MTRCVLVCTVLVLGGCFETHGLRVDAGSEDGGVIVPCATDGRACDDGDPCTTGDQCRAGVCAGSPMRCEEATACLSAGVCVDGECVQAPRAGPCDDGDPCTTGDACVGGACAGEPRVCDAPDPPVCVDATVIRETLLPGECVAGACRYPVEERTCPDGCVVDACACVATPWASEIVDDNGDVGRTNVVAIDQGGAAHVAYYLAPLPANLRYASRAPDGTWRVEDVDTIGDVGSSPALVIDDEGLAHIVHDDLSRLTLRYARQRSDGGWDLEDVETGGTFFGGSLAVRDGVVHVAYTTETPTFDKHLRYAERGLDGAWRHETLATGSAVGVFPSLALDALGGVHVVHLDSARSSLEHAYRAPGDTNFVISTVDDGGVVGGGNAIAADRTGGLHVAYFREDTDELVYALRDREGDWTRTPVPGTDHARWNVDLAVDAEDAVHVLFDSDMPELFHAYRPPHDGWRIEQVGSTGFSLSYLGGAALALDALGDVHVSHYDERERLLRYATRRVCP